MMHCSLLLVHNDGDNCHHASSLVPIAAIGHNPVTEKLALAVNRESRAILMDIAQVDSFFLFGSIIIVIVLAILIAILWKCIKPEKLQKLLKSTKTPPGPDCFSGNLRATNYLDYRTLKKATNNFHHNNQLGRGGFGPVYQGVLDNGTMIAVKQLSLGKSQQGESEFLTEVRMITSIQHKNLVRLVGCCSDGAQRLLVYEYMKNKSLESILYGNCATFLNWKTRFQIILGIARGLQYLHEDSNLRIVHRDIKPSNILLDDKFQPKIGDFGLARFFPEDQAYLDTTFAGTLGYTAPEYAIRGELSEKADIYSFGVLVLEIVSSRKNTDLSLPAEMQYLPEYAWRLYEKSKIIDLVDPRLQADGIVEADVLKTCQIAFLCLQPLPSTRPPMSEVVAMLMQKQEDIQSPMRPAFLNRRNQTNKMFLYESLSEQHSAPMQSSSNNFPPHTNKSQESASEVPPPFLRTYASFPQQLAPSPLVGDSPVFSSIAEESRENVSVHLPSLVRFVPSSSPLK